MSTRAIYSFGSDNEPKIHIYKHWDGYPSGAKEAILAALEKAWGLPRYEYDEFASAFVAANKTSRGNIRIIPGSTPSDRRIFAVDIEYRYEITFKSDRLHVKAAKVKCLDPESAGSPAAWCEQVIHDGPLNQWVP